MLVTEKRDLMPRPTKNSSETDEVAWFPFSGVEPLEESIWPEDAWLAKRRFLDRYAELVN
jgi:hypothetical protein